MSLFNAKRKQGFLPLALLTLGAGYVLALLPLARQAENLKAPLEKEWRALAGALGNSNSLTIDFLALTNRLAETRQALQDLSEVRAKAGQRTEPSAAVRERMTQPFQLVDYEIERGKQQDDLRRLAAQRHATLGAAVFEGFPAHTTAVDRPALLWAELEMFTSLLHTALACDIANIHSMSVTRVPLVPRELGGEAMVEVPVQIEFTAPASAVKRFLQALPLRATELKAANLPEIPCPKAAFYLNRVMLRKQTPEQPEELRASLRVVGFILRGAT